MSGSLHEDEIPIDGALVRTLVDQGFPHLAGLRLSRLDSSGSTNALFRLGPELLVRMPRQPGGTATIEKEARWLPQVGPALPVAVPEIVAVGDPAFGYPERWSVVRWLDGDLPSAVDPMAAAGPARTELALDLAGLVTALSDLDVPKSARQDPSLRSYRGDPLASMDISTRENIRDCRGIPDLDLDLEGVLRVWDQAMALPGSTQVVRPRWYHGDLCAENLLVRDGRLVGVLDFGGLAVGDPSVDLVPAWEVLDAPSREVFRVATGVDDATWLRGRAWALALAAMTFPYYWTTMPARCADRLAMARSVLADS